MRVLRGWGVPEESEWPYDTRIWPPEEPEGMDTAAKKHRICAYQRVRTLGECKLALARQCPVQLSMRIVPEDWRNPPENRIPMPANESSLTANHAICVVGYDERDHLIIQNSWGEKWGDQGYAYLPQRYFERYHTEAWIIPSDARSLPPLSSEGTFSRAWGFPDCLGEGLPFVGIELYDGPKDECVGWAFLVKRQGYADIEEFFIRPSFRGRGFGTALAELVKKRPQFEDCPLRLWIGHVDRNNVASATMQATAKRLGLSINPSRRNWASYVGM
ncbi:GNAT family N-acetyltransferase [Bradyrhizobium frederickii]|nr:GNAT family N-acetyltransferase [Bradyrhizobium frederickii]